MCNVSVTAWRHDPAAAAAYAIMPVSYDVILLGVYVILDKNGKRISRCVISQFSPFSLPVVFLMSIFIFIIYSLL